MIFCDSFRGNFPRCRVQFTKMKDDILRLERWLLHSGMRGLLWQGAAQQYISLVLNPTHLAVNVHAAGGGLAGVAPPPFGGLCETNISMLSQAMPWLHSSDCWRWRHCMRGQERQEKWEVWKMWEKRGGGKQKVKQSRLWQGRAPLCQRQRRGQMSCPSQLPGRDEGFCVYQGLDNLLQTGIILQIEDQPRNRTRKSKKDDLRNVFYMLWFRAQPHYYCWFCCCCYY